LKVLWKGPLELQCDPLAHDTHRIDGVDQGLGTGFEDIAAGQGNHGSSA
jgi:hypothetical protein